MILQAESKHLGTIMKLSRSVSMWTDGCYNSLTKCCIVISTSSLNSKSFPSFFCWKKKNISLSEEHYKCPGPWQFIKASLLSVIIKIMMSQVVQGKWFLIGGHQQVQNADCQRVNWGQHATVNKQMSLSVSCL